MDTAKREALQAAGFRVGGIRELLGLSPEEEALVELKLSLSAGLKRHRQARKLTQAALARRMRSSQSRVAKMEAGDPTVSLDLIFQALLTAGATRAELGALVADSQTSSLGRDTGNQGATRP